MTRAVKSEPADSFQAFGAQWFYTRADYLSAVLPTGHVDVYQVDDAFWRVRCFDPEEDFVTYAGTPEYEDRDEALEMAVAISEELARRRG